MHFNRQYQNSSVVSNLDHSNHFVNIFKSLVSVVRLWGQLYFQLT